MRLMILFFTFFVFTIAIREPRHECFTCDSFCDCISPKVSLCPPETRCYTLRSNNGDIEHMGCAESCNVVNRHSYESCEDCVGDLCSTPTLKLDVDFEKCFNRKYENIKRDIGSGATFNNHQGIGQGVNPGNNGIGQGVNPGMNTGIGQGINPQPMGIGSGAAPGFNGIGQGTSVGQAPIGAGSVLDRPHHLGSGSSPQLYQRHAAPRDIGDGVNPGYRNPIGSGASPFHDNSAKECSYSKLISVMSFVLVALYLI